MKTQNTLPEELLNKIGTFVHVEGVDNIITEVRKQGKEFLVFGYATEFPASPVTISAWKRMAIGTEYGFRAGHQIGTF